MNEHEVPKNRYLHALDLVKQESGAAGACFIFLASCIGILFLFISWAHQNYFYDLGYQMQWQEWLALTGVIVISFCFCFLVIMPLTVGVARWFYLTVDHECPVMEIFYYFHWKTYLRCMSFLIRMAWRMAFLIICCMIPSLALYWIDGLTVLNGSLSSSLFYSILIVLESVAFIGGIVVLIYYSTRFFLAPFLLFEREDLTPEQCIHHSVTATRGEQLDLVMMLLSLMPLYLCCVIIVPLVFVVPYFFLLCSIRSREMMNNIVIV